MPGSRRLAWLFDHGTARYGIRYGARRGDLIARLNVDPELLADPYPAMAELRARGPVVPGPLVWASCRYESINRVLRDDTFGVGGGHAELPEPVQRLLHLVADPLRFGPLDPPSLLAVDAPDHTRYRKLVSRVFTPRSVAALEPRIREVAESLLDGLEARGRTSFDLIEEYAAQLPLAVIADVLGVPDEMQQSLLQWGNGAARLLDPGLSWRDYRQATDDVGHMHTWFDQHVARLRRTPGDDLLSRLAMLDGDDRLTDIELAATGLLVLGAGFETTVNLIGNAVVLLDQHPDQLAAVQADPSLWTNAVEECLRVESPVQLTMRQAYADTTVSGTPVPKGQPVLLMLAGANRDPDVFTDPDRFDVRRENAAEHLAFSAGVHFCLGPSLARLEARVALETLYTRLPTLRVDGTPQRRPNRVLRGFDRLPVGPGAN
ncbi:hypothetical protein ASD66_04000 [Nocardioides sp. Root151]|nr:hypothetical protein ASD66_04000 [Nocardioides sp. Root151]